MTKVMITANPSGSSDTPLRATTNGRKSVGRNPGAALDALVGQLDESQSTGFVVVQSMRPDEFFTAAQQQRLSELLAKRRNALDVGGEMAPGEQNELEALIDAELDGAIQRVGATVNALGS